MKHLKDKSSPACRKYLVDARAFLFRVDKGSNKVFAQKTQDIIDHSFSVDCEMSEEIRGNIPLVCVDL